MAAGGPHASALSDKFFNSSTDVTLKLSGDAVESEPLYKLKAEFFKTLAHPARIRILELLVERDRSVGELLSSDVGLESSNLSQQLGVLRRAGVVAARRDGNAMIYSIAAPDIAELLAVARKVLARVLSDRVAVARGPPRRRLGHVTPWVGLPRFSVLAGWSSPRPPYRRR